MSDVVPDDGDRSVDAERRLGTAEPNGERPTTAADSGRLAPDTSNRTLRDR